MPTTERLQCQECNFEAPGRKVRQKLHMGGKLQFPVLALEVSLETASAGSIFGLHVPLVYIGKELAIHACYDWFGSTTAVA